ncbi:unnamed protein product [Calypogeia fissa]
MGQAYSHEKEVLAEKTRLQELQAAQGTDFPGSDYKSPDAAARKEYPPIHHSSQVMDNEVEGGVAILIALDFASKDLLYIIISTHYPSFFETVVRHTSGIPSEF